MFCRFGARCARRFCSWSEKSILCFAAGQQTEATAAAGGASGGVSVCICQDDYHWWKNHDYLPSAGKPLWFTAEGDDTHPIFFVRIPALCFACCPLPSI